MRNDIFPRLLSGAPSIPRGEVPRPKKLFHSAGHATIGSRPLPTMMSFDVGPLSDAQRATLEQRLTRCLGVVVCVRHPPAIDDVSVVGNNAAAVVVVSACCELSSRRAKILVTKAVADFADDQTA